MNGGVRSRFPRMAAAVLVLAALLHVQWLAACEFMPASGSGKGCCAENTVDRAVHCGDQDQGHDCVTPFAKGASGIKLADRATPVDTTPADGLFIAPVFQGVVTGRAAGPPARAVAGSRPNGRSIYLSSSRLRL